MVGTSAQNFRGPRRSRVSSALSLLVALLVVVGLFQTMNRPVTLQSSGHSRNIQLADMSGSFTPYSPAELWGGGSPVEDCLACTASSLVGSDKAQSVQPGQEVMPATGDFSTTHTLFSSPAVSTNLGVSMTYDSERSASSSAFSYFGYGWAPSFSPSFTYDSSAGTALVNEANGAQLFFGPPSGTQCPVGDFLTPQKYTVPGSSVLFCAPNRTDAQAGFFPTFGAFQLSEQGGKPGTLVFNYLGQLAWQGDLADTHAVGFTYSVSPGSANCPNDGQLDCVIESDAAGRTITAIQSGFGPVTGVFDPSGNEYTLNYDSSGDLASITNDGFNASTWQYTYSTSVAAPYNHQMMYLTTPDDGTTQIKYDGNGMVTQTTAPTLESTNYGPYEQTTCATPDGCTTGTQYVPITYPDGEIDGDNYADALLSGNFYGPSASGGSGDSNWAFNYLFPPSDNQDAPTVEKVVLPGNSTATITTDSVGNVLVYTDPKGNTTNSMYDQTATDMNLDELCWQAAAGVNVSGATCTSPPSGSTRYTYDTNGNLLSETDPLGNTTTSNYYTNGLLCWTAPPTVSGGSSCTNSGSSPTGAPTGSTDYTYDPYGDMTSETVAAGTSSDQETTNSYDALGRKTYTVPPDGQGAGGFGSNPYETAYSYYGNNNVQSETAPLGRVTSYIDDLNGNVVNQADPGGVTSTAYDLDGRVCWTLRAATAVSNPSCGSAPGNSTVTGYWKDTTAPSTVTNENGHTTTYTYANVAYPTEATETHDPMGAEISHATYDAFGRACVTGPVVASSCAWVAGDTFNNINNEGQLLSVTDPSDLTTSYLYANPAFPTDPTSRTAPSSGTTQYTYDADGRLTQTTDGEGNVVTTAYDADGRKCYQAPTGTSASCSSPPAGTGVSTYSYTPADQRSQMVDNNGAAGQATSTYSYDASGHLTSTTDDNGRTINYSYDVAGEVSCLTYPVKAGPNCANTPSSTNSVVDRTYDGDGRLATTSDWLGHTVSYSNYNPKSELGQISYPTSSAETLAYGYDPGGNLTSGDYSGPTAGINSWTYNADEQEASTNQLGVFTSPTDTYNSYQQVTAASNPTGTGSIADTYTNAPNGELQVDQPTGESPITYGYNSDGQVTSTTNPNNPPATTDSSYAYTPDGQRCFTYTSSGYYTGGCGAPPSGSKTNQWNAYGQLCWSGGSNSFPSCSSPQAGATTYTYNGDGLRMTDHPPRGFQFDFSWDMVDGGSIPLIMDDGDYVYIYGPTLFGGTAPVEQIHLSTNVTTFLSAIPSGVQDVLSTAGALKEQSAYTTYGNQVIEKGTESTFMGFQGTFIDPSGLIYLVNRYYDPTTGQFVSVDPNLAMTDQAYAYTGDDPLNHSDPLGLFCLGCQIEAQADMYRLLFELFASQAQKQTAASSGIPTTQPLSWHPSARPTPASGPTPAQQAYDRQIGQEWIAASKLLAAFYAAVTQQQKRQEEAQAHQRTVNAAISDYINAEVNPTISSPVFEYLTKAAECISEIKGDIGGGAYVGAGIWYAAQDVPYIDLGLDAATATGVGAAVALGCGKQIHIGQTFVGG